jgi:dihydrolipoamide dehydrogenase
VADQAGVAVTDRGFINVDIQMRTHVPHKALHEGHVAAEVIAGELQGNKELVPSAFNSRVIPSVAYTDTEIAWVGLTETEAKAQGIKVKKGLFSWAASGRATANGRTEGFTKLLFDDSPKAGLGDGDAGRGHSKIAGCSIVGPNAGDMLGEIALAIEMGADAVDIGKTIHPHPSLGESIGMAAEVAHGSCTDLPPTKK